MDNIRVMWADGEEQKFYCNYQVGSAGELNLLTTDEDDLDTLFVTIAPGQWRYVQQED